MCQIQSPIPKIIKSPTYSEITHVWQYLKPCVHIYQKRNKNQKGQTILRILVLIITWTRMEMYLKIRSS